MNPLHSPFFLLFLPLVQRGFSCVTASLTARIPYKNRNFAYDARKKSLRHLASQRHGLASSPSANPTGPASSPPGFFRPTLFPQRQPSPGLFPADLGRDLPAASRSLPRRPTPFTAIPTAPAAKPPASPTRFTAAPSARSPSPPPTPPSPPVKTVPARPIKRSITSTPSAASSGPRTPTATSPTRASIPPPGR
jgi:hypothetical protein